ncbi:hypothetical protein Tco_0746760 [Tanacetum coccineum]
MYKEYLAKALENSKVFFSILSGGIFGEVGVNTFRNAIGGKTGGFDQITNKDVIILYSLANGINIDYANIFWEDIIIKLKKKQRKKALKPNQPKEPPFIDHMLAICAADKQVVFKAPKTSSKAESVSQGTKPGAQTGHKKPLTSSKQPFVSSKEATKGGSSKAPTGSKTGYSKKRKESSSAMDSNPSQPLISTPMDIGMHKEDQQATGGPTSLGVTSEARANPQLSSGMPIFNLNEAIYSASFIIHFGSALGNDALAASTAEADPGNSAPSDFTKPNLLVNGWKLSSLKAKPSFPNVEQLKELLVKSLKTEFSNILSTHDFNTSLPIELKDLPSKFNDLTEEVKGLKNQVHNLLIKLAGDLKDIPPKLEDFTKTITSLTPQIAELKTLHLLNKVTNALNRFAQAITSKKTGGDNVPSAGQAGTQPAEGEMNINQAQSPSFFKKELKRKI